MLLGIHFRNFVVLEFIIIFFHFISITCLISLSIVRMGPWIVGHQIILTSVTELLPFHIWHFIMNCIWINLVVHLLWWTLVCMHFRFQFILAKLYGLITFILISRILSLTLLNCHLLCQIIRIPLLHLPSGSQFPSNCGILHSLGSIWAIYLCCSNITWYATPSKDASFVLIKIINMLRIFTG